MTQKIAALFSGQGSQYPGMGKELYENSAEARSVYECAGDILGFDVAKASFEGTVDELSRTLISQPAIFTLSMAAFAAARDILPPIYAAAGHSLGEFAALCCAGAYSLEDGFRLIKARASAMDLAAAQARGAMYAIIGSDEDTIESVCNEIKGFVTPVNYNLPNQTVISGEEEAAASVAAALAEKGAKTVKLSVSSAFHTKMMASAAERFKSEIAGISFQRPKTVFYSNLTGEKHEIYDYPEYFALHMISPVRFASEAGGMARDGVTTCVEFGPGKTVSALARKNVRSLSVYNVEDTKGLEGLRNSFCK